MNAHPLPPLDDRDPWDIKLVAMLWRHGVRSVRCGSPLGRAAERLERDGIAIYTVDPVDPGIMHVTFDPSRSEAN